MADTDRTAELLARIQENVGRVIVGKESVTETLLMALICGGHVLIEDVPGLGKTTLVSVLARSLSCGFRRIQFTPDVLPSDVTGYTMFNMKTGERETVFGAVMSQIVLADEINRTSPKTQSSLLEVMQEGQVTIDGVSYKVEQPFMVLATQNPVEQAGTYPLPEAQLDRFLAKVSMGYPSGAEELEILRRGGGARTLSEIGPVATAEDVLALQQARQQIVCAEPVLEYIVAIARKTRDAEGIALGVSPRGALALRDMSMARALLRGRSFVLPDDVQSCVQPVLAHRLVMDTRAGSRRETPEAALMGIVRDIRVPAVS